MPLRETISRLWEKFLCKENPEESQERLNDSLLCDIEQRALEIVRSNRDLCSGEPSQIRDARDAA